jgi:hypothetical protein
MRHAVANQWRTSLEARNDTMMMRGTTKLISSTSPTNRDWFEKISLGMHKRMGDESRPNKAISIEAMMSLMKLFNDNFLGAANDPEGKRKIIFSALFAVSGYAGGLRGEEIPLMDLYGTHHHYLSAISHSKHPHVVMALRGRFKNEFGELYHLMPLVEKTKSGLEIKVWFDRMLSWYEARGIQSGPVFRDARGQKASSKEYEFEILSRLERVQTHDPEIIPASVDVFEEFGISRSFRRGSCTHAREQGVSEDEINLNNRWSQLQHSKGRKPKRNMQEHYTDVRLLLKKLLRYSASL